MLFMTCPHAQSTVIEYKKMDSITFVCAQHASVSASKLNKLFTKAFYELGLEFKMVNINLARALIEANEGRMDGLCSRIKHFEKHVPQSNLIRVDVPIRETKLVAWGSKNHPRIKTAADINENKLSVVIVRGALVSESFVAENHLQRIVRTASIEEALGLLEARRVDLLVGGEDIVGSLLRHEKISNINPIIELKTYKTYPYLHSSWQHLIPELEKLLDRYMTEDQLLIADTNNVPMCTDQLTNSQ